MKVPSRLVRKSVASQPDTATSVNAYNAQYGVRQVTVRYQHHPLFGREVEVFRADPGGFLVRHEGGSRWIPRWMTSRDCDRFRTVASPVLSVAALARLQQLVAVVGLDDGVTTTSTAKSKGSR